MSRISVPFVFIALYLGSYGVHGEIDSPPDDLLSKLGEFVVPNATLMGNVTVPEPDNLLPQFNDSVIPELSAKSPESPFSLPESLLNGSLSDNNTALLEMLFNISRPDASSSELPLPPNLPLTETSLPDLPVPPTNPLNVSESDLMKLNTTVPTLDGKLPALPNNSMPIQDPAQLWLNAKNGSLFRGNQSAIFPDSRMLSTLRTGLQPGQTLLTNESITSSDQQYLLTMLPNCNLVLNHGTQYNLTGVWTLNSGEYAQLAPCRMMFAMDGALVLLSKDDREVWRNHGKAGTAPYTLRLSDGAVVIDDMWQNQLWSSAPGWVSDHIVVGEKLPMNRSLISPDKRFELKIQSDCNAVVARVLPIVFPGSAPNAPIWSTNVTNTSPTTGGCYMAIADDGVVEIYNGDGTVLWNNGVKNKGDEPYQLSINNNGVVVETANAIPIWKSQQ